MASPEQIRAFQEITSASEAQARQFLGAAGNDVAQATNLFFESGQPPAGSVPAHPAQPAGAPAAGGYQSTPDKKSPKKPAGRQMGLADLSSGGNKPDGSQEYFAGGGQSSGTAIIGAGGPKKDLDVKKFFDDVRDSGAVSAGGEGASGGPQFRGQGVRLGMEPGAAARPAGGAAKPVPERRMVINFWADGFSVDDGPLRDPQDDSSQLFLADIKKGVIPAELKAQMSEEYKGKEMPEIVIELKDNAGARYAPPAKVFKAFAGQGRSMRDEPAAEAAAPAASTSDYPLPNVDAEKEQTQIVINMPDRTRLTLNVNLDHKVGHIRAFVIHSQSWQGHPFNMATAFPRKVLSDDSQTIAEAGLKRAVISVTLK
eukprot:Hpha_TRINITY_DN9523_c0_g1::TRINITY_DN9523_c0_g1_i1::g.114812::m.114812/K14012/SHP1, UBX1, NSFL1C; UBX domain-containing protein 1